MFKPLHSVIDHSGIQYVTVNMRPFYCISIMLSFDCLQNGVSMT